MNNCIAYISGDKRVFVEDAQVEWPHKWPHKTMYYDVIGECKSLNSKQLKKALNLAMTTWDVEIDVNFIPLWSKKNQHPDLKANITIDFKDSTEEPMFKEKPSVLAYAYFPGQGDVSGKVVFNNDYIWGLNEKRVTVKQARERGYPVKGNPPDDQWLKVYNIIHVLIHELGHSLGLRHDFHDDSRDVMDAYYSGKLELSEWDIYRIRLKYPIRVFSKWTHYDRLKKALNRMKVRL